jgi:hypothetical protein
MLLTVFEQSIITSLDSFTPLSQFQIDFAEHFHQYFAVFHFTASDSVRFVSALAQNSGYGYHRVTSSEHRFVLPHNVSEKTRGYEPLV